MNISKISLKETKIKEIPQDWKVVRLEYIATKIGAGQTAPQGKEYFENGKFPFIRVKHLNYLSKGKYVVDSDLINEKAISEYKLRVFPKGSIIFPKSGESIRLERRAILQEDSYVANHFCVIIPNREKINDLFLFYYLAGIRISGLINQTTTPSINLSQIKKIRVSVPSFLEQQKIASVLLTVDEDIQITNEVIKKTKTLKQGLMQSLLTRGIGHTRFKKTDLGQIPQEWEIVSLEDVLSEKPRNGIYKPRHFYDKGDAQIIQLNDLYSTDRVLTVESLSHIKLTEAEKKTYQVQNGDILVNRVSKKTEGIGKIVLAYLKREPVVFESNMFRIRLDESKMLPEYLSFFGQSPLYKKAVLKVAKITNRPSIDHDDLQNLRIAKPPIPEQQYLVDVLSKVEDKLTNEMTRKGNLELLRKGLIQDLLTGQVRVKGD